MESKVFEIMKQKIKRFRDWPDAEIPPVAAGVYCIWDKDGRFIYVGMSGREISKRKHSRKIYGLVTRLGSHASGRLSGDQFCVYVANRIIIPELKEEEKELFRQEKLTLDMKVKDYVKENLSYRYILVDHENEAVELERYIQEYGMNGELPYLNGRS